MNLDQQQQKGLFTFYRQQADLEDQLKFRKQKLKQAKEEDRIQIKEKKLIYKNQQHSKSQHQRHKKTIDSSINFEEKQRKQEIIDSNDQLIELLRKHNNKELKKKQNLRMILESQEQSRQQNLQNLKKGLSKLTQNDHSSYFRLIMAQKAFNSPRQKLQIDKKQDQIPKINPFQKLAIIPTNFINQFQKQTKQKSRKKSKSPSKNFGNSLQVKRNDKTQGNEHKQRYEIGNLKDLVSSPSNRINLPKISHRANSQAIHKNQNKISKIWNKSDFQSIKSQRSNYKPDISLFLDSVKIMVGSPSNKLHTENKIYSLFIENRQNQNESKPYQKSIILADVLKKMKFS